MLQFGISEYNHKSKHMRTKEMISDYRVKWLNRSKGNTLTSDTREFDSDLDALRFAHELAPFSGNA